MKRIKNFRYMVREQGGLEQLSIENMKCSVGYLYIWHSMSNIEKKRNSFLVTSRMCIDGTEKIYIWYSKTDLERGA